MIARDTVCATREWIGQCSLMWRPMRSIADFQSRWVCLSFFHCRRNACLTRVYLIQITVNGCHNHHVNSPWDAIPNLDFFFGRGNLLNRGFSEQSLDIEYQEWKSKPIHFFENWLKMFHIEEIATQAWIFNGLILLTCFCVICYWKNDIHFLRSRSIWFWQDFSRAALIALQINYSIWFYW